jgi:hypothetical protein
LIGVEKSEDMHHIKNIPHYIYSMYHDIAKYKFVRKSFLSFFWYIALSWITFGVMSCITNVNGVIIPLIVMSVGFLAGWLMYYFGNYYPMIRSVIKEVELQDKYPYLYNKFIEKE